MSVSQASHSSALLGPPQNLGMWSRGKRPSLSLSRMRARSGSVSIGGLAGDRTGDNARFTGVSTPGERQTVRPGCRQLDGSTEPRTMRLRKTWFFSPLVVEDDIDE